MKRSWQIWIAVGLCLTVVLAAMAWVSIQVIRLDKAEAAARQTAVLEENVRLSLWRMDSALAPLMARESIRPYFAYKSFYPAQRVYTRMFARIQPGEILVPSPILKETDPYIHLYFQLAPDGRFTSPQVPQGNMRDLAENGFLTTGQLIRSEALLKTFQEGMDAHTLLARIPRGHPVPDRPVVRANEPQMAANQSIMVQQQELNVGEWQARKSNIQRNVLQNELMQKTPASSSDIQIGVLHPVWVRDMLLLARRVSVNGDDYLQGCWLDWPKVNEWMLSDIKDLLPNATLVPAPSENPESNTRSLAALPVMLIPGELDVQPRPAVSPLRISLAVVWICLLLSAAAVALLLFGAVSLSERRAAFVSAVTHELRTPLTTFQMYTEMLARGMIQNEEKRQTYFATLHSEANRLGHLVENVLAYARLEKGRDGGEMETVSLHSILERIEARLSEHAHRSGMRLVSEYDDHVLDATVRVDISGIERILFNLVDNACKYARSADDKRIHLKLSQEDHRILLKVIDHGPGIDKSKLKHLFRPFHKSAGDAANSAPGVGLGLSLCRRLARKMRGDLVLEPKVTDSTCFTLILPAEKS